MRASRSFSLLGSLLSTISLQAAAAEMPVPAAESHAELQVPPGAPSEEPPPAACTEEEPPPAPPLPPAAVGPPRTAAASAPQSPHAPPVAPAASAQAEADRSRPPPSPAPLPAPRRSGNLAWRALSGHYFIPTQIIGDAFPVTSFGMQTAAFFAGGSATVTTADAEQRTLSLALTGASHGFALQLGMTRFLAAGLSLRGAIASGVTMDALELGGTDAGFNLTTHILGSIPLRDRIRIGLQIEFEYSQNFNVNFVGPLRGSFKDPIASFDEILDRIADIRQRLLSQRSLLIVSPRVLLAVGLHRAIGLRVQLGYSHERVLKGEAPPTPRPSLGLVMSWDLGAVTKLPLGLLTGYRLDAGLTETGPQVAHTLNTGLFYTGRPHLALGIEGWATLQRPFLGATVTEGHALFTMKHYW